jgi:endopolyphosphatase
MEWLRIQLQILRDRGMKAILTGHVPPARVDSKVSWDETCWQKYTLWMRQYRDVVLTSIYGHMNMEHFMLQDFNDIKKHFRKGVDVTGVTTKRESDKVSTASSADYLVSLRDTFKKIPAVSNKLLRGENDEVNDSWLRRLQSTFKSRSTWVSTEKNKQVPLSKIGGQYGERYSLSFVGASVVPNYMPTLRVYEYNITGLEDATRPAFRTQLPAPTSEVLTLDNSPDVDFSEYLEDLEEILSKKKKEREARHRKKKKHNFKVPDPPSKSSPPGPAYSPQTLSLTGYTQYYANLTHINNDFVVLSGDDIGEEKWKPGHHGGKVKHGKPKPKEFTFQVEYDTFSDKIFALKDLTVRSYLRLAKQIAASKSSGKNFAAEAEAITELEASDFGNVEEDNTEDTDIDAESKKKKKHKKHKKKKKHHNKVWNAFVRRAFVGTVDPAEVEEQFRRAEQAAEAALPTESSGDSLEL